MDKVIPHKHDGTSQEKTLYTDLEIFPEDNIAGPSGGLTIDSQARSTLNSILLLLKAKKLMK